MKHNIARTGLAVVFAVALMAGLTSPALTPTTTHVRLPERQEPTGFPTVEQ